MLIDDSLVIQRREEGEAPHSFWELLRRTKAERSCIRFESKTGTEN